MATRLSLPPLSPTKDLPNNTILQGSISRWLWRIYTQRLTAGGRWFALATAVFIAYGGASLQVQGYVLAGYAAAIWLVAMMAVLLYRPRVSLSTRSSARVCAGETIPVDVEIEQQGRLRGADLVLVPHRLPMAVDSVPADGLVVPDLKRGQRAKLRIGLRCNRRGNYTLGGYRVETGFAFGISRSRRS